MLRVSQQRPRGQSAGACCWKSSFVFTMWHMSVFFYIDLQLDTVFPPFNFSHEEPSNDMHVFDIKGKFAYI